MNENRGLALVPPGIPPPLDPGFRPAVLANRAYREMVSQSPKRQAVGIALEQDASSVSQFHTEILADDHPGAAGNHTYIERIVKFLLWSRGGSRIYVNGPLSLVTALERHYSDSPAGRFDSEIVGERMFDRRFEVIHTRQLPAEHRSAAPLGRHLNGCRIGFDLGGSDRKVAALIDGKVIFSDETVWDPYFQSDPKYHFEGVMDSLKKAAAQLPRVDAIGGSAAGIYVNNRVKVASLFRGVSKEAFDRRVRDMFQEIKKAWNNIPFEVINDGEVTALAGSMSLNVNKILGISLGTSTAGGYVNAEGNITSWINELAFVPLDYNPNAPRDEWSGDYGCSVQYFSQQCVGRLLAAARIETDPKLGLPEKLKVVQNLMQKNDPRPVRIYETIGVYLGYAVAHFTDFYDMENVLILGRVTSGSGGEIILSHARKVLEAEFPEIGRRIRFHIPDEKEKRHGQAVAAASLPQLKK
jgi:predicted NBD/HSP70 family sugar kinase